MFRVAWTRAALDELTQAWTRADSDKRAAITAATQGVDRALQDTPEDHGESRPGGYRVTFHPPLGVAFQVQPRLSTVRVVHVWTFRRRGER